MRFFYSFFLFLILLSCEFEDMPPTGSDFQLNDQTEDLVVEALDTLTFTGSFEDDLSLDDYFLSILPLFDTIPSPFRRSMFPFIIQDSFPLIGTSVREFREIIIPAYALAGTYAFEVSFADEENQLGPLIEFTFAIENPAPFIVLENPLEDTIRLNRGDGLAIEGIVEATAFPLDSVSVVIMRAINDTTNQTLFSQVFTSSSNNINPQRQEISLFSTSSSSDTGQFDFSIFASDEFDHSGQLNSILVIQ